jgi:hypothetical protein
MKAELATIESRYDGTYAEHGAAFGAHAEEALRERVEGAVANEGKHPGVEEQAGSEDKMIEAAFGVLKGHYDDMAKAYAEYKGMKEKNDKTVFEAPRLEELRRRVLHIGERYESVYPFYEKIFSREVVEALRERVEQADDVSPGRGAGAVKN